MDNILVTGGLGYIGSHFITTLNPKKFKVIVVDNLSNSSVRVIDQIKKIINIEIVFYKINLSNEKLLDKIFKQHSINYVVHFAGLKSVNDSIEFPDFYYDNNVTSTDILLEKMLKHNVKKLIFSSSATVYGHQNKQPVNEDFSLNPINPYGETKKIIEDKLANIVIKFNDFSASCLRYFNPVGAHSSALIGENSIGSPNNLMPYLLGVASGKFKYLKIFGDNYNTPDGSGLRDYIHVMDLAESHNHSINFLKKNNGLFIFNIGTGKPYSVFDLIKTFEEVNQVRIPYQISNRRNGDVDVCYANVKKANDILGWKSKRSIEQICIDAWKWELNSLK